MALVGRGSHLKGGNLSTSDVVDLFQTLATFSNYVSSGRGWDNHCHEESVRLTFPSVCVGHWEGRGRRLSSWLCSFALGLGGFGDRRRHIARAVGSMRRRGGSHFSFSFLLVGRRLVEVVWGIGMPNRYNGGTSHGERRHDLL